MRLIPLLCCLLVACIDSGSDPESDDTGSVDAGAGVADAEVSSNALGQTCAEQTDCPADPPHQCVVLQSGNPELGYCSPSCGSDADCAADYTGPANGTPTCFVPDYPEACSILCDVDADCPTGLECKITGGPVNVCATI